MTARHTENCDSGSTPTRGCWRPAVFVFAGGDEIVIHAMPARKKYVDLLP